eukprot:TRINITY_DN11484_c0_g2_i1.p1 TRINITY_DN11484_c0_g2~~TRINITY_DN11484_c0_g2_i1.p1  ORF type:complete len:615 (-),score=76.00 TRINITY_DN11484_c0_g2_i1:299-2143(-)
MPRIWPRFLPGFLGAFVSLFVDASVTPASIGTRSPPEHLQEHIIDMYGFISRREVLHLQELVTRIHSLLPANWLPEEPMLEIISQRFGISFPGVPFTPLHFAAATGCNESVALLLRLGTNPSTQNLQVGLLAPVLYASGLGKQLSLSTVQVFASSGAKLYGKFAQHPNGMSLLHIGIRSRDPHFFRGLLKILVEAGAAQEAVQAEDAEGFTPMHLGCYENTQVADFAFLLRRLVQLGARLDSLDMVSHQTPLHLCAMRGNAMGIQQIARQADTASLHHALQAKDRFGRTPIDVAAEVGFSDVLKAFGPEYAQKFLGDVAPRRSSVPLSLGDSAAGGWRQLDRMSLARFLDEAPRVVQEHLGGCDFDVREASNLTAAEFERDFFSIGKPVLILNATSFYKWQSNSAWTRRSILKRWGSVNVPVADIPYPQVYLKKRPVEKTLRNFIEHDMKLTTNIVFDADFAKKTNATRWPLDNDVVIPPLFRTCKGIDMSNVQGGLGSSQFSLGGHASGAHMHAHNHAFQGVVYGMKHWVAFDPSREDDVSDGMQALEWLRRKYSSKVVARRGWHCTQPARSIMYMPSRWSHSTLNIGDTIGVAREFCRITRKVTPLGHALQL